MHGEARLGAALEVGQGFDAELGQERLPEELELVGGDLDEAEHPPALGLLGDAAAALEHALALREREVERDLAGERPRAGDGQERAAHRQLEAAAQRGAPARRDEPVDVEVEAGVTTTLRGGLAGRSLATSL